MKVLEDLKGYKGDSTLPIFWRERDIFFLPGIRYKAEGLTAPKSLSSIAARLDSFLKMSEALRWVIHYGNNS